MRYVDLFGVRREPLQDGLNCPGLSLSSGFPQEVGRLFRSPLSQESLVKALFELQPAAGDARRVARLTRLPTVGISWLKPCLWIPGLARFEFIAPTHAACSDLSRDSGLLRFERRPAWTRKRDLQCVEWRQVVEPKWSCHGSNAHR